MVEYALKFHALTTRSRWNEPALKAVFCQGLDSLILTELACCDEQQTLDSLTDLAIKLDNLLTVDIVASESGEGGFLFEHFGERPKLHPVAFFSRKLTPAKQNYDIGNRELLTIKLALEKYRHWLEGAAHPFIILTDHKNLKYLKSATVSN